MSTTREDETQEITIPSTLPLLAVRDVVVFPNMVLPLFVGRETSVLAIEAALAQDRLLFLATQKDQAVENPEPEDIYAVGTVEPDSADVEAPGRPPEDSGPGQGQGQIKDYSRTRPFFQVGLEVVPETAVG